MAKNNGIIEKLVDNKVLPPQAMELALAAIVGGIKIADSDTLAENEKAALKALTDELITSVMKIQDILGLTSTTIQLN
jgi:hypothetical protein